MWVFNPAVEIDRYLDDTTIGGKCVAGQTLLIGLAGPWLPILETIAWPVIVARQANAGAAL